MDLDALIEYLLTLREFNSGTLKIAVQNHEYNRYFELTDIEVRQSSRLVARTNGHMLTLPECEDDPDLGDTFIALT